MRGTAGSNGAIGRVPEVASSPRDADTERANQHVGKIRGFLIILSVWGLIFLQAANMSGITTTQSKIAEDLDSFIYASWFSSTYLIALSSLAPVCARLAQIFSPRICILFSAILFAIGGFVTSQAHSLTIFLLGRAISGSGGAGMMTIALILVLELSSKKKRGLFVGLVNAGFTTGVSFGAVLAGALLPVTGWRFLFWVQAPLALVAATGLFLSIPSSFTSGKHAGSERSIKSKLAKVDYLGAVLLIATLISLLYGLSSPKLLWQPIALSSFFLASFIATEVYIAPEPIIPVIVLKSRGVLLSCVAQLGIMSARWMVLFYSPVYAIALLGWSPASAGSILIPTNVGFAIGGLLVGWLHIKRGGSFWLTCVLGYFLFSCTLVLLSQITRKSTPAWSYFLSVFVNGLCTGASLNYTLAHLLYQTPASTHYITISLMATFRGFGGSFGSAIGGGLFTRILRDGLEKGFEENGGLAGREDLVRRLLGSPALVKSLHGSEKAVAVESYTASLSGLLLAGAGLALVMVCMQAGTGWKHGAEKEEAEERDAETGSVAEEEWEEGMEQGV